jgi:hypothetical protein
MSDTPYRTHDLRFLCGERADTMESSVMDQRLRFLPPASWSGLPLRNIVVPQRQRRDASSYVLVVVQATNDLPNRYARTSMGVLTRPDSPHRAS